MHVAWVELAHVRSYETCRMEPEPAINVLVGKNGAGKTNFLEALYYLSALRSFRGLGDETVVREGAESAVMRCSVVRAGSAETIAVSVPRSGRRRVEVNGKAVRSHRELPGHLRVVLFFPDDLDVIKSSPAARRSFIDEVTLQIWPAALGDLGDYGRALRQRNSLLRQYGRDVDRRLLDSWDDRMSQAGGIVLRRRAGTIEMLNSFVSDVYGQLAGGDVTVAPAYRSTWGEGPFGASADELAEQLLGAIRESRGSDLDRRTSLVGPHRDDPGWSLDGRDTRSYLSQGEQRTLALALRLASQQALVVHTGEPPVLLLDDVFSELDLDRAKALAGVLPDGQTFITTTREEEVPVAGRRWTVTPGAIR